MARYMTITKTHPGRSPHPRRRFRGTCPKCGARYTFDEGDHVSHTLTRPRIYAIYCQEGGCGGEVIGEEIASRADADAMSITLAELRSRLPTTGVRE